MAAPFVYVPEANPSTPYYAPCYATSQGQRPFIPPAPLLYPSSPYTSPNAFNPDQVLWPEAALQREYPPSWVSFAPRRLVHPFLNGEVPSPSFHFDLAPGAFSPQHLVSMHPPQGASLGPIELSQAAFHPPLSSLRILHPRLPFWPVDLPSPARRQGHPISLGDVLVALHRSFHTRITDVDWATLDAENQALVTRAFITRCRGEAVRTAASPAQIHDREEAVRKNGVLRMDFLLGKTVFKGLVRHPEGHVELVTA